MEPKSADYEEESVGLVPIAPAYSKTSEEYEELSVSESSLRIKWLSAIVDGSACSQLRSLELILP